MLKKLWYGLVIIFLPCCMLAKQLNAAHFIKQLKNSVRFRLSSKTPSHYRNRLAPSYRRVQHRPKR